MGNRAHPPPPHPQNRGRVLPVLCQKKEVLGLGQDPGERDPAPTRWGSVLSGGFTLNSTFSYSFTHWTRPAF